MKVNITTTAITVEI